MARPTARVSALIASATTVGFLLAGCSGSTGAVIGVPSSATPSRHGAVSIDNAINQAIENELIQAIQEDVIARIEEDCLILDLRTVFADEEPALLVALVSALA